MTPRQIELVQTTWESVVPISETAAGLFYNRLFELDPELRPMFTTDIKEQGVKLMQMITIAVRGLNNIEALVPALNEQKGASGFALPSNAQKGQKRYPISRRRLQWRWSASMRK